MSSTVSSATEPFRPTDMYEGVSVSDRLYTALAEHFPGGAIALLDSSLRILMIGGTELAHYGVLPRQLVHSPIENFLPADIHALVAPHLASAVNGTAAKFSVQYKSRTYTITATPVQDSDGVVRSALAVALVQEEPVEQTPAQDMSTKLAGEQLHMDNEAFQLLLQATSDGIWDWDLTSNSLLFSVRCGEMLGYPPDNLPTTFSAWLDFVHPDDHPVVDSLLRNHIENNEPFYGIIRMYHRDGSIRWILKRGFSLKNEQDIPYRMVGSCTDMTELRHQQEKHLKSERKFRSLIQHSSDLTIILDKSAAILYQNAAFTQIFGRSSTPRNIASLLHPDDLAAFRKHFETVLQTHAMPLVFEGRYRRADGSELCVESVFTNLLNDSGVQGVIVNSRDISERKRAEQQMSELNALLLGIMESTGTSIYSLDRELRYTAFSSSHKVALKTLLNVDIELGHPITEYMPSGSIADTIIAEFHIALAGERRTVNIHYGDEANPTYNEILINPIYNDGEITGIAVFISNTTARQIAQQQLSRAYDELELRVHERTADLQQTMEQLHHALSREKELSELKTRFVSMVSHEFRTPLTSILSSVEILDRYRDKLSNEQQVRFYYMITESVRRMSDLLNDVVLLGRAESNNIHFNPVHLLPDQYCRELLAELQQELLKDRVIEYHVEGVIREVLVDPQLLRYILTNLLSNAAKYSPEQEPISLSMAFGESSITFRVADRGIGIAPEDLKHIYEPFFRSELVETIPGTGLGLSIVRQSVARHGGTVEVETNDKDGTTFTVRLPV